MPRFNQPSPGTKTTNFAGGQAHSQTPELELVSILLTSFANDQFHESATQKFDRLKSLVKECDKEFVAKAAIYARTVFGMRSITHVVASELAKHITGQTWAKDFYEAVIYRPDDMMEILSYHTANNGKVPNSMKKGLAKAFDKFNKYSLAKYRGEGKAFKLVDVVNLVHPVPVETNAEAIRLLIKNDLKSFDTWETELTKAGQEATNDEERVELKKEAWATLVTEKKLGYFALLRNLRNIIEHAPEVIKEACEQLIDYDAIKKSLVMPFRFTTAFDEIQKLNDGKIVRDVLVALNTAVDIAVSNVPKFEGENLIVLDESSSMTSNGGRPAKIGALFAAVLVKACNADLIVFGGSARYFNVNPLDSTITIARQLSFRMNATNFHSIFQTANKKYDRIFILSDMQAWVGENTPHEAYAAYKRSTGANPYIYSFDLAGHGTMQFPENNVFALAGFSDKVFDIMGFLEQDKKALVNGIKKLRFGDKKFEFGKDEK